MVEVPSEAEAAAKVEQVLDDVREKIAEGSWNEAYTATLLLQRMLNRAELSRLQDARRGN